MATHSPSNRAAIRAFIVVTLAVVVLAYSLPDLRRTWQPLGNLGYASDSDNVISGVDVDSAAAKAGLKVGDRIDIASADKKYRGDLLGAVTSTPGQRVTFAIHRGAREHLVTLVSEPESMGVTTQFIIIGREFVLLLFVGIGALLVLRQPSTATWGFYFYCLGLNVAPYLVALTSVPAPWNYVIWIFTNLVQQAGFVGVLVFATVFLHERIRGWRKIVYRMVPFALLVMCALSAYGNFTYGWLGWPEQTLANLLFFMQVVATLVAIYAFVDTYARAQGSDRQRVRWVILGFGIALVAYITDSILESGSFGNPPYWLHGLLNLTSIVVPLTVAYAVVKHRVIDVSFVVSRALVYGVLTSLLVGIFALIDWLFIDKLKLARLGTLAEMGVAVAGGFWFNSLHKRVDSIIDATFFRQRHKAELQLGRNAAALPFAKTPQNVAQALVNEPVRSLVLASAALFRVDKGGAYVREESVGWDANDISTLHDDDGHLLMLLQAEDGPLSLYEHPWRTQGVPSGPARPVLALPINVRTELTAIAFYGSHVHGEALDPDEIKVIAALASGAAVAYDHLEAEAMKREVESIRRRNEALEAQLAEAQIQPA